MEKLVKNYLYFEGVILLGIFFSGFYDPSFWLYGVYFIGTIVCFAGVILSIWWYQKSRKLNQNITVPVVVLLSNLILLAAMALWLQSIFSGGLNFWI